MKLWHSKGSRSLRPLWALEEMGLEHDVEMTPFPPRVLKPEYLEVNPLGTIPFFIDGDTQMTESVAICQYLVDRYQRWDFGLQSDHPEYGNYLNWLQHSESTLTFPQTLIMRYHILEPSPEKQPVADDYAKFFIGRLCRLNTHLENHDYLVDGRFTIADITVGYALYLGEFLKLQDRYSPQIIRYIDRLKERDAFQRADNLA
ncbi:MAG: glutathione S-transferase [Pseudohongiellaceae bacterium]|jgi:glutathione S-transferase